jgi:hypothetical protein
VSWIDAPAAGVVLPAMGVGIGAGMGALIPGKRRLIYSAGAPGAPAIAPIAGKVRRGAAVHVGF